MVQKFQNRGGRGVNREEAENRTRVAGRERNFLAETWYCGIINQKIEAAVEQGQYEVKVRFSARSYPARHQQRFIELYEQQGYDAHFRPNYVHIAPSMFDLIIRWYPERKNEPGKLTDGDGPLPDAQTR